MTNSVHTTSPLHENLTTCCHRLRSILDDKGTTAARLRAANRALGMVDLLRQVVAQAPVKAPGDDFIGLAAWLHNYYVDQQTAASEAQQDAGSLLGADGKPLGAQVPQQVVDGLASSAAMWREVVKAARPPHIGHPLDRELVRIDVFAALRIWTHFVAALAAMFTSGGVTSRQEAIALASMLRQHSSEAAAMAGLMGGDEAMS